MKSRSLSTWEPGLALSQPGLWLDLPQQRRELLDRREAGRRLKTKPFPAVEGRERNASTTAGSNCVPAADDLRFSRLEVPSVPVRTMGVTASRASATAKIRASKGIRSFFNPLGNPSRHSVRDGRG